MANSIISKLRDQYADKKVLVVGLGLQGGGVGVAKFFAELGSQVSVTDKKTKEQLQESISALSSYNINYTFGEHKLDDFLEADVIFKGPSVSWDMPEIVKAQEKGIPIEMEAAFFVEHSPATVIGITGTRGKSTTTSMIYEGLMRTGKKVFEGGNIPNISTISLLKEVSAEDYIVLELSSWALSGFHRKKISPHIAVFTNIYPDHLNYYKSMEDYLYDKKAIYLYQKEKDFLIANKSLQSSIEKDSVLSTIHFFTKDDFQGTFKHNLQGDHNKENAAAALMALKRAGMDESRALNSIEDFYPLSFRQELLSKVDDTIQFVNDTTSTTPVATIKAIEAFSDKPMVLILGGNSKGLPTQDLLSSLEKVKKIVLLKGSFTDEIMGELKKHYAGKISEVFDDLKEATQRSIEWAKEFRTPCYILLSPGATSFAMFKNEFDRGEQFNEIVKSV